MIVRDPDFLLALSQFWIEHLFSEWQFYTDAEEIGTKI